MKSLAATERVCRLSLAPKAVTEMKPLVAVPLLLIADIIGSADQMPTDRSLNRAKKTKLLAFRTPNVAQSQRKNLTARFKRKHNLPNQPKLACSRWWHACSAGCNRFKGGSGINGILPAERAPAIYSVPPLSRLHPALRR